jgi:NAD(P)-dependent dehydrogenase (short-subunit alcohol dehydrogenase family)
MHKSIFDLGGKVALITGGGSGLGRAYCEAMAEFGADVVCVGRTEKRLQQTLDIIRQYGHRGLAIKADVSRQDDIENIVERTVREMGRLDIVFANASDKMDFYMVHEMPLKQWDDIMALNLRGVFLLMRTAFPHMIRQKGGSFITTVSIAGIRAGGEGKGVTNIPAYGAAKAGAITLTQHAAVEYGKYNIRVNAIAPGMHLTDVFADGSEATRRAIDEHIKLTPLGRVGLPENIKGVAVWLASDASSMVTGQTIVQDGGMII